MSRTFKWHMLITSFIPLWVSILIVNIWHIVNEGMVLWDTKYKFFSNVYCLLKKDWIIVAFSLIILLNMIVSSIYIIKFIKVQVDNNDKHNKVEITNIKQCSNVSAEYLIAYILPMLVFDFTSLLNILLFILYFSTLSFLTIRNNHVYVNILLEFKKYKIYKADVIKKIMDKSTTFTNCIILSKNDLCVKNNTNITYFDFENTVYLDLTEEKEDDNHRD